MTRRTWFKTLTASLATLATGLGWRKKENTSYVEENPDYMDLSKEPLGVEFDGWKDMYCIARFDENGWHFEDVKPEEE